VQHTLPKPCLRLTGSRQTVHRLALSTVSLSYQDTRKETETAVVLRENMKTT